MSRECPKCGSIMIKRNGRYGQFFGCSSYPRCKHTEKIVNEPAPIVRRQKSFQNFVPSNYQRAINDTFTNCNKNMLVSATAGSGKTTLLLWLASQLPQSGKYRFLAFNRAIAQELAEKLPDHVSASTLHAHGFATINANINKRVRVDDNKTYNFLRDTLDKDTQYSLIASIKKLVSVWKNTIPGLDASDDTLAAICDDYNIPTNGRENEIFSYVRHAIQHSTQNTSIIDFDDMVWLPVIHKWQSEPFDVIMVDEAQDLNPVQMALLLQNESRFVFVGDRFQSIYGFRGADHKAMDTIKSRFNCIELPLSLSYRNSKAIGQLVNLEFPHIVHEVLDNAAEGEVASIPESLYFDIVKDDDLVLCRNNAPMVAYVYKHIKAGRKASIRGRDIGENLVNLIAKMNASGIGDLIDKLETYRAERSEKLNASGKQQQIEALHDQIDCIIEIANEHTSISAMISFIDRLFSDDKAGVQFSTVHRAKGLESDTVFIIRPELMPSKYAVTEDDRIQEENIRFVAYTRARLNLYFV